MSFRFTIGKKIGLGFGALIILTVGVFMVTNTTLNQSKQINDQINDIYNPSVAALEELKLLGYRSKLLIYTWVYSPSSTDDNPDKLRLNNLTFQDFPRIKKRLFELSEHWTKDEQFMITSVFSDFEDLWNYHNEIKSLLNSFESYNDSENKFLAEFEIGEGGRIYEKTDEIIFQLDDLIKRQKLKSNKVTEEMISSFDLLQFLVRYLGIGLVIGGILIAIFTTRTIVKPVYSLKNILLGLSKGIFPSQKLKPRNDEIGEMVEAMDTLVEGLKRTKDFAEQVGSGNFEWEYQPLSEADDLGHALIKMRDDLEVNERELENKVKERTAEVVKQKEELEQQSKRIGELYTQVTDSIRYAKRLQEAILPPPTTVKKLLPNCFILYKPKDIVSGDFYWMDEKNGKVYYSAVDCTGHGVPGAFMSIVAYNNIQTAFNDPTNSTPANILNALNKGITKSLHQKEGNTRDGMDMAICAIEKGKNYIEYAGANNALYIVRNGQILETKPNKQAIGSYNEEETKEFTNHVIEVQKEDMVYIFSDGYADQFGGAKGKKLMYKKFRQVLIENAALNTYEQQAHLNNYIENWKDKLEQVDDILVIGLRIS
ncbi:MAG: SpoIIE family protein phosphatase [Flavobacteriales bacterium]|nr:SpoIIE family protein phosphatase [Flavobacteriales bacterium]